MGKIGKFYQRILSRIFWVTFFSAREFSLATIKRWLRNLLLYSQTGMSDWVTTQNQRGDEEIPFSFNGERKIVYTILSYTEHNTDRMLANIKQYVSLKLCLL